MRETNSKLQKLVVILGPTASGKTSWSLQLAKKFDGEIISADSRQVFKKMNIGTAKVLGEWKWNGLQRTYLVENIPHHLIDFLDPGKSFTLTQFRDRAVKHIKLSHKHNKLPMLVGGTGLYIQSLVDNYIIPKVPPNKKLRKSLEEKSLEELHNLLKQMDPDAAKTIDAKNGRRLVRALEVCIFTGEPFSKQKLKGEQLFDVLLIGIDVPRELLYQRIDMRVDDMIEQGLVKEIKSLVNQKYSWELPSMNGVGYKEIKNFINKESTLEECIEILKKNTRRLARKQLTWFRKDKRIKWVETYEEAENLITEFMK